MAKNIVETFLSLALFLVGRFVYDFIHHDTAAYLFSFTFGAFTIACLGIYRADVVRELFCDKRCTKKQCEV